MAPPLKPGTPRRYVAPAPGAPNSGGMPMGGMGGGCGQPNPFGGCGAGGMGGNPFGGMPGGGGMGGNPMGGGMGGPFGGMGGGMGGQGGGGKQMQPMKMPKWGRKARAPLEATVRIAEDVHMPTRIFATEGVAAEGEVERAIDAGFRHFDCASNFGNLRVVGRALERTLESGAVERADLFVTTKLWRTEMRDPRGALKKALRALRLEYVDVLVVHFPFALMPGYDTVPDVLMDFGACWRAMERLVDDGLARCLGVAHFEIAQLRGLLSSCRREPAINQIERHLNLSNAELVEFCQERKVAVAAINPTRGRAKKKLEQDPLLKQVAERKQRSVYEVVLRWHLETGCSPIAEGLEEPVDLLAMEMDGDDLDTLAVCDRDERDCHAGFRNFNRLPRDETWAGQRGMETLHDHVVFAIAFLLRGPLAHVGNPLCILLTRCFAFWARFIDPETTIRPLQDKLFMKFSTFMTKLANEDRSR